MAACSSSRSIKPPEKISSPACLEMFKQHQGKSGDEQLDIVSDLYNKNCFYEVISLGDFLRTYQRDKFYNVSAETAELFTPEGSVTEYVMESFERAYLAILMSLSYLKLNQQDDALVELRRAAQEQDAGLYNFGEDPIVALLMAAIWDRFDTSFSRPFWRYLSERPKGISSTSDSGEKLSQFAKLRLKEIDAHPSERILWSIQGYGTLPQLLWKSDFISQKMGPYFIYSSEPFVESCQMESGVLTSTEAWAEKIAKRYQSEYHPFLFAKSLLRLPVGIGYGVLGTTAGIALGAGGCALAVKGGGGGGREFCQSSMEVAGKLIKESVNFAEYTLKPDLRHWRKMPRALSISRAVEASQAPNSCELKKSSMTATADLSPTY